MVFVATDATRRQRGFRHGGAIDASLLQGRPDVDPSGSGDHRPGRRPPGRARRRKRRQLLAAGHLCHPGGGAVRPRPVDRHDLLFGRRQCRPLGELRARRPHRGRPRHGVELHPADADLYLRAEGAGRPVLLRRHRAVGQLRLDRVGQPGRAVGRQHLRCARRFDDRRSAISFRPPR